MVCLFFSEMYAGYGMMDIVSVQGVLVGWYLITLFVIVISLDVFVLIDYVVWFLYVVLLLSVLLVFFYVLIVCLFCCMRWCQRCLWCL